LGGKFEWEATGTSNVIHKFDDETLRVLKQSVVPGVFIGRKRDPRS
jgi:hypothetical protein